MIDNIPFDPVTGDAIVKSETISWEQMRQEMLQETLMHNPEMNAEMKLKWNKERLKHFKSENEYKFFPNDLSEKLIQEDDPHPEKDPEFQDMLHEKYCIAMNMKMCFSCCELDLIYDRDVSELADIPSEDLLDISRERRLGIDAKLKVLGELVERLYKGNK